jgi:hypothetical protein
MRPWHAAAVVVLVACVAGALGANVIPCPIDCSATPNVQAEVDACVKTATLCNPFEEAVPRDQWATLLDITDPSTVTTYSPIQFLYVPTNETVDRVSCVGLVANDTLANGTIIYVCIQRFFCYIDPEAVVNVALSGVCLSSTVSFPGVLGIFYNGPAIIVGGAFYIDPLYPTTITFDGITFDGGGTIDGFFSSCMQNSNVTIRNSVFVGWAGDYVLRAEACDYIVRWVIDNVTMYDIPGTPYYLEGLDALTIVDFTCDRCALRNNSMCGYIKMAWSASLLELVRMSCWRVQNLLPPRCRYCLTGPDGFCGSRCNEGVVQAYNRIATASFANCPIISQTIIDYHTNTPVTIDDFDPVCRVYSLPVCNFITALDSQNYTRTFTFPGGDIIWDYDAPLICEAGGTISPFPGPFFVAGFQAALGDQIPLQPIPPLPPSPGFVDGEFEDVGVNWAMTPGSLVVATSGPPARSPTHVFQCDNGLARTAAQTFRVRGIDLGQPQTFAIYAQPSGSPDASRYNSRYIRLLIDGDEVSSFVGPALDAALTPGSYVPLIFAPWNASSLGTHTLTVECDFTAGSGSLRVRLDDATWTVTSTKYTQPLLDGDFEPHILTWSESQTGQVVRSKAQDGIDCNPRSGLYRYTVSAFEYHYVDQQVTFATAGVFGITGWVQRRSGASDYAGLTLEVRLGGGVIGSVGIDAVLLPNQDEWTFVEFVGQIVIPAPGTYEIGVGTNFATPPTSTCNLCIDDVQLLAIGNIGVTPDTLGFSAQHISSAPFIANQTCTCEAYPPPDRNPILLPCAYAITDESVCVEQVPSCCAQQWLNREPLIENVFWLGTCNDLNDPACVFLLDCRFTPSGLVLNCTQVSCPNMTGSGVRPLPAEPNVDYLYGACTAAVVTVANGTWTPGSLTPAATPYNTWSLQYAGVNDGVVFVDDTAPSAFYTGCPQAGIQGTCNLYDGCTGAVYNATSDSYIISGCNLLNCSQPALAIPTTVAEFAACTIVDTGVTLLSVDGGWVFQANGSAMLFTEPNWLRWLRARDAGETHFTIGRNNYAALASACTPHAYFRACPCLEPGSYTVPADADPLAPGTDTFYSCAAGVSSCRCNQAAIDASNPAPPGTVTWWIANAPTTLGTFRVIDNRAQQHEVSWVIEQLAYETQTANTIVVPQRVTDNGQCRLLLQNDNEFATSTLYDCLQGNPGGPYTTSCNIFLGALPQRIPCPIPLVAEEEADCLVDDRATPDLPDFGNTIFNVIQDAINTNGCDSIFIRFTTASSYFEEDILIDKSNKNLVLWSTQGAVIVGRHTIDTNTDNVTFVGLRLIVPGDNQNPLFSVNKENDKNLGFVVILNSDIDGSGCRKCGLFNTARLNILVVNWTSISGFEFFANKLDDIVQLTMAHNQVISVVGRAFLTKYSEGFIIDSNTWIDVRGGADLKGAAIFSLTATSDSACDGSTPSRRCLFRNNVHIVNVTQVTPRFQDVCYYFSRGSLNATTIYDNVCRLAENGFVFVKMKLINSPQLVLLMQLNPLVRPSLTQIRDPANPLYKSKLVGTDYVVRGTTSFVTPGGQGSFVYSDNTETDYDTFPYTLPNVVIRCEANRNWDSRFGFGTVVVTERMGVQRFSNVSIGVEFCQDRRVVPPVLGGDPAPAFILYVRSFNGSRLTPERITMQRDGWLYGDDTAACCRIPQFKPAIIGNAHRLLIQRFNMTLLTSAMPVDPLPFSMWTSGPLEYPVEVTSSPDDTTLYIPAEVFIDSVQFDGRYIQPQTQMYVLDLIVGVYIPINVFKPQTNKLPPATSFFWNMHDSVVERLRSYSTDGAVGGGNYVPFPGRFPSFDAIRITAANRINANSIVHYTNNVIQDVDRNGLYLVAFNTQIIDNCTFYNCSGRAFGNYGCVRVQGNDVSKLIGPNTKNFDATAVFENTPAVLHFTNSLFDNTRPVLFPRNGMASQPGLVQSLWADGWPNTTDYCIINTTSSGLPLGMRESSTSNFTLLQCSLYTGTVEPLFPDRARYLRSQCLEGNLAGMQGTEHDLGYGIQQTDEFAETIWCDSTLPDFPCCPLVTPPQCWVVQTPSLITPTNPWYGVYVFASLSTAIEDCAATQRVIIVVGSSDPFGTGDTSPKVYTEVISATVPLVGVNGTTGPILIQSGSGVTWASSGNNIVTQCVFTTFQGFSFVHPGSVAQAIWQQTTVGSACNLRFKQNVWNVTVDERAMFVLVGDNFTLDTNNFHGSIYDVTRRGVELFGTCIEQPVTVINNKFDDYTGFGLSVDGVAQYVILKNEFSNVGGRDTITAIPFSVFASVCAAPPLTNPKALVRFETNRVRTTQTVVASLGLMATCWLGNVPLNDKKFSILNNNCRGLEIGIRFENMPDTSPSDNPKQQLRTYAITDGNINSEGFAVPPLMKRFDLVRGPPADDGSLATDPNSAANKGRWCTNGCPTNLTGVLWAILAVVALCLLFWLLIAIVTGCCTPRRFRDPMLSFVATTQPAPINPALSGNGFATPYDAPLPPLPPGRYAPMGAPIKATSDYEM